MMIPLRIGQKSYPVVLEEGGLARAGRYMDLNRKTLIVTDEGVPPAYAQALADQCASSLTVRLPQGEGTKSFAQLQALCERMLAFGMTRSDCVAAVGGGVVGDLSGFAAACYMRGIDFYNVPTTLLAQVDSSVGGKTAVNLGPVKNIVGAFHQPKCVIADPALLATLPPRQIANGMAEAVKMALCFDAAGFTLFETEDPARRVTDIIERAIRVKKSVVEQDEKEAGLRRALNFGHTLGHGIESLSGETGLYHGECVALGMLPMCAPGVRARLLPALKRLGLPTRCAADADRVMAAALHDKKMSGGMIQAVVVEEIGRCEIRPMSPQELRARYIAFQTEEQP